jgi:hypothetical protein
LDTLDAPGFDRLLSSLESLTGTDEMQPAQYVRITLTGAKQRGWEFEDAWRSAINRIQPPNVSGVVDPVQDCEMREARALLEEDRPAFQAAYEGREETPRERTERVVAAWGRLDGISSSRIRSSAVESKAA